MTEAGADRSSWLDVMGLPTPSPWHAKCYSTIESSFFERHITMAFLLRDDQVNANGPR